MDNFRLQTPISMFCLRPQEMDTKKTTLNEKRIDLRNNDIATARN